MPRWTCLKRNMEWFGRLSPNRLSQTYFLMVENYGPGKYVSHIGVSPYEYSENYVAFKLRDTQSFWVAAPSRGLFGNGCFPGVHDHAKWLGQRAAKGLFVLWVWLRRAVLRRAHHEL